MQGRYEAAEELLGRAMEGARADGNPPVEASALCNLSRTRVALGRTAQGIALAEEGIAIYERVGHTLRLANARYALGVVLTQAGRLPEAMEQLGKALEQFETHRQRLWEGTAHFRIAQAHLAGHRPARAAQHAEQALSIGCIGGDRTRGNVLIALGRSLDRLGQRDRARACWYEALLLLEQCGAGEAAEVRGLLAPLSGAA